MCKTKWIVHYTKFWDGTNSSKVLETKTEAKAHVSSIVKAIRKTFRNSPEYKKGDKLQIKKWFDNTQTLGFSVVDGPNLYETVVMHPIVVSPDVLKLIRSKDR